MRLAFYTPTTNIGGYEKVVLNFVNYIADNTEHEVWLVCGNDSGVLIQQLSDKVRLLCLHARARNLLPATIKCFKELQPDVWYSGFRFYNAVAVLAKKFSGCKNTTVCISQHGFEDEKKWIEQIYTCILKKADCFVAVTESVRQFECERLKLSCPSFAIGNPVIDSGMEISPVENEWFDRHPSTIAVCARLSEDKNISLAINILHRLHQTDENVGMVVMGSGPCEQMLKEQVETLGLSEHVLFPGYVNRPIDYMARCSAYLHTCDREGFGNTVVEAMYAGLPIATTDCQGPVNLIEQDRYGICFGNGRTNDAADRGAAAIQTILQSPEKYSQQRLRAENFRVENITKKLLKIMKA